MTEATKPTWASNLSKVGLHYYAGIAENAEEVLEKHKLATHSTFGTRSSVCSQMQKSDPIGKHRSSDSESTPYGHQSNKENDSPNQHPNDQCTAPLKIQPLKAQRNGIHKCNNTSAMLSIFGRVGATPQVYRGRCSDAPGLAKAEGVDVAPRIPTLGADDNSSASKSFSL